MHFRSNTATWLMNMTEVDGAVDFRSDGVMFSAASGVEFFSYASNALIDVTAKINASSFQINATFASAAKYYQDFSRWGQYVLYIGNSGLFAYDMTKDQITPILLSPDSDSLRVDYRYPVALDDGTAFVTGLTSTSTFSSLWRSEPVSWWRLSRTGWSSGPSSNCGSAIASWPTTKARPPVRRSARSSPPPRSWPSSAMSSPVTSAWTSSCLP